MPSERMLGRSGEHFMVVFELIQHEKSLCYYQCDGASYVCQLWNMRTRLQFEMNEREPYKKHLFLF